MSVCSKCGRPCEEHMVSIIEMGVKDEQGHAVYKDSCFDCAVEELRKRWRWIPITIEVPHFLSGDTNEEISSGGGAINYIAELIDFPEVRRS